MVNTIVTIIIVLIVLAVFIVLFYFADMVSNEKKKKDKSETAVNKEKGDLSKKEKESDVKAVEEKSAVRNDSMLADEIDALIIKEPLKKPSEEHETASSRSRMHMRRAHMMQYYDKKYKVRDASFIDDAFEINDNKSGSNSNLMIDGVEITKDDIKKLTALQNLIERKEFND